MPERLVWPAHVVLNFSSRTIRLAVIVLKALRKGAEAASGRAAFKEPAQARVSPSRLQIHTAKQIIQLIREDELEPGFHFREEALAERLGVSRTSIRAGLRILHEKGLLTARQNRGFTLAASPNGLDVTIELPTSADETLYMAIAQDRLAGRLPQSATETELMRRYDCGRHLVLAALAALSEEGLVRRGRGREWQFREILNSPQARKQSYELRLMVEPAALLLPGFSADRSEISDIRTRHLALIEDRRSLSRREVFDIDAGFHEMLARFSRNDAVLEAIRQQNRLRRLMEYESYPDAARVWAWSGEHVAVIDALLGGDRKLASDRLAQHLRNAMSQANGMATQNVKPKGPRRSRRP
jgi:DNA-binding GntR family transcriptional regulator